MLFALTDLASYLQQDLDTATATVAHDIAAGAILGHLGQSIEEAEYTHTLPVAGDRRVRLPQRPVTAITTVADNTGTLTADDDWTWDTITPMITVAAGAAADGWVAVTYTAGYTTIPTPIKAVALGVAARAYSNAAGLRSEQIDDYNVTYAGGGDDLASVGLLPAERRILNRYRAGISTVVPA